VTDIERGMAIETAAETYHRLSSYSADRPWLVPVDDPRARQDFIPLLRESTPAALKRYARELPRVVLPDPAAPATGAAALLAAADAGSRADRAVRLDELAAILALSAGPKAGVGASATFRAAGSAGNRHPYEVYVTARGIAGLPDGVWRYEPGALALVGPAARGETTAVVITGLPWRSCWRYAERGYRHVGWDCGTVACHVVTAAAACGLPARLLTAFDDAAVAGLVGGLPGEEAPMCVVALGAGEPALEPGGAAEPGLPDPTVESFPLVGEVHAAGTLDGPGAVEAWRRGHPSRPAVRDPLVPDPVRGWTIADLVRRRASARRLDPAAVVPIDAARWLIELAAAALPWDAGDLHEARAVVHAVAGLEPGVHVLRGGDLVRTGPAERDRTFRAGLSQEQARDAAVLIFLTPAPGPGVAPEARSYRAGLLGAGFVLGRIYLAAAALGLGCTGLTFVDSQLPETIGAEQALGLVAVCGRR
jgi:nitroreductase